MRTRKWQAAALVAALVFGLGLGACGDDDDDDGTTEGGDSKPSVTIANLAFSPNKLTVASGASIAVTNNDSTTHTFTSDDAGFDVNLEPGKSGEAVVAASEPGTYDFMCTIHSNMTGTVTVT